MKVVFTDPALEDIETIRAYIIAHYPHISLSVERRFRLVFARIGTWPEGAQRVVERPDVRMVPLVRYPYKIFYRIKSDIVEILHIHHSSRE